MSDQRASLHAIIFLGMAGIAIILVLMMVSMQGLEQAPAGLRAKLANAVAAEYKFENVVAEFHEGPKFKILHVSYVTRTPKPDFSAKQEEMRDVAQFVNQESQKYQDPVLFETEQIDVKRLEVAGSGCFQSTMENAFTLPIPRRVSVEPK